MERNVEMFSTMERALVQVTQPHKLSCPQPDYDSPGLVSVSPASLRLNSVVVVVVDRTTA